MLIVCGVSTRCMLPVSQRASQLNTVVFNNANDTCSLELDIWHIVQQAYRGWCKKVVFWIGIIKVVWLNTFNIPSMED